MRGMTKISPVATGGIVAFHPPSLAVRLRDGDRLCDSLGLLIQTSFLKFFNFRKPGLTMRSLRPVPCIPLSGLSSPI